MTKLKNIARFFYRLIPESYLKKFLTGKVYKFLYKSFLDDCYYHRNIFYVKTKDNITIKSMKIFDPEPFETLSAYDYPIDSTVMDLGGNIGATSIYLSHKVGNSGRVYVYEPDKENYDCLLRNIRLNKRNNIIPIQKGIWNENTTLTFYSTGSYTSSFLKTEHIEKEKNEYSLLKIPAVTIDSEIKRLRLKKLNFIKIDIEGSEKKALEGASKAIELFHPDILIETHMIDRKSTSEAIIQHLKRIKYKNIKLLGNKENPTIFAKYRK